MNLYLYSTKDCPAVVNKTLKQVESIRNVRLLDNTSILTPTIELALGDEISNIDSFNYFYIPQFSRYYFITDITAVAGMYRISGRVDVLKTYADDIKDSFQIVTRQENKQDRYLHDNMIPISDKQEVQEIEFGDTFDDSNSLFILVTTGQQGYESEEE